MEPKCIQEEKLPHLWELQQQIYRSGHNGIKQLPSLTAAFSMMNCVVASAGLGSESFLKMALHPFAKRGYGIVHYRLKNIGSFTEQSEHPISYFQPWQN